MIRVVVAARSAVLRTRATALLANRPGLKLLEVVRAPADLLARIESARPDVLLLGTGMLEGAGGDLMRRIRLQRPMPVILLTAAGDARALAGLEDGAAEFLILPALTEVPDREEALGLIREVAARGERVMRGSPRPRRLPAGPATHRGRDRSRLVVVGASTGGPQAVQALLEALPATLNAAILVALHMPATFTGLYAERLDRFCRLRVREAEDGDRLVPGTASILPGGHQADLFWLGDRLLVRLRPRAAQEVHAPSVDQVMRSAAAVGGASVVGVVLTGMGEDGARGLAAIRAAGGDTFAESERTALIFGMPGEAIRRGAAATVLPLDEMPEALLERCGVRRLPANTGAGEPPEAGD